MQNEQDMSPKSTLRVAECLVVTSIITCTVSVFAIWIALPEIKDGIKPSYDHQDVLIGILSILVTVLLAWNIYSAIDAKRKIENIEKYNKNFRKGINKEIEKLQKDSKLLHELIAEGRSATSCSWGVISSSNGLPLQSYSYFQDALYYSLDSGDGMVESNTDLFLVLMENVIPSLKIKTMLTEKDISNINKIKERMDYIILHPNKNFTSTQRERFALICREFKHIYL